MTAAMFPAPPSLGFLVIEGCEHYNAARGQVYWVAPSGFVLTCTACGWRSDQPVPARKE